MSSGCSCDLMQRENYNNSNFLPNLKDRKKYVMHYKNLHIYLSLGTQLRKVYRILHYKHAAWLQKHIAFNTEHRK